MTLPRPARSLTLALLAGTFVVTSCGNWTRVGSSPVPSAQSEMLALFDPNTLYARLGRLVSSNGVPFVGMSAYVPGPGDSTIALVGISLANRAFTFERSGGGFVAHYHVEYEFGRPSLPAVIVGRDASIQVASFEETTRTDESILEQQRIPLVPGAYLLTVRVRDLGTGTIGSATAKVTVPPFGPGSYTAPILAYRVRPRASRNDSLSLVLNPRGTVSYGGDTLLIYVEGNAFQRPVNVPIEVTNERDSVVLRSAIHFDGTGGLEGRVIRLAPDSEPLGQLEISLGTIPGSGRTAANEFAVGAAPEEAHTVNALVSFSPNWIITNFDDLLSLLRYFGEDRRVEAMRRAKGSSRLELWEEFYHATDPDPATPENEALDRYFARLALANERFREGATPGWLTDRGEVFISLGEPDVIHDQSAQLQNNGRVYVWEYQQYQLQLFFQDMTGFGRYQLTPDSRAAYNEVRARVAHRPGEPG